MRKAMIHSFGITEENLTILYGPESAGYDGKCTREALLSELENIVEHGKSEPETTMWIFFLGHANRIPGDTCYNLPGPDLLVSEIENALKEFPENTPLVIAASNSCSAEFFKHLTGPGRVVFSAARDGDPVTTTEFEKMLPITLGDPKSDLNEDGLLSVVEIFRECQRRVLVAHEEQGYLLRENSQFDGNGDGTGTQRPSREDAEPAASLGFHINSASIIQ